MTVLSDTGRPVTLHLVAPIGRDEPCPTIIFSHGANAAPRRYEALLSAWADAGYVVIAPLHVDSEEHRAQADYDRAAGRAARLQDYALACAMVRGGHVPLRLGVELSGTTIAAGHSYGALIAQVAAGARLEGGEHRAVSGCMPISVIAISPPPPMPGVIDAQGWATIGVPHLSVTGTCDILPGFVDDWRGHLSAHHALVPGLGTALVFEGMDHYFGGAFGRLSSHASARQIGVLNAEVVAFARDPRTTSPRIRYIA